MRSKELRVESGERRVTKVYSNSCNIGKTTALDLNKATSGKKKLQHKRIRGMSMDKFYQTVTGDEKAFYKICLVLPSVVEKVIENSKIEVPNDTVISELMKIADEKKISMAMAVYMLGFGEYSGFNSIAD